MKTFLSILAILTALLFTIPAQAQRSVSDGVNVFTLMAPGTLTNGNNATATFTNVGGFGRSMAVLIATNVTGAGSLTATLRTSTDGSTWTANTNYTMTVSTNWAANTNSPYWVSPTGAPAGGCAAAVGIPMNDLPAYISFTNVLGATTNSFKFTVLLISPKQYRP